MRIVKFLFVFSYLFSSCNNQGTTTENTDGAKKQSSVVNCYQYAGNADTITLKLIHVGESITGTLVYNFKEKDKNKGTIQGAMKGDLFVADYTFMSEGVQSIRQVAFKLDNKSFTEGYGESLSQNDKVLFKNLDSLNFNQSMRLVEIACQ